jgi:hypothetical protein
MQYDRQYDELLTVQNLPSWEAYPKAREFFRKFREQLGKTDPDAAAIPISRSFLPAIERVMRAQIRVDRRIAALRIVEAIRLYAAAHDGKLPKSLAQITVVTIPVDPLTGKAFEYQIVDGTAVLKGAIPPEEMNRPAEWLTYEITIKR